MCASATAPLHWNAIPVFADIEADTFCIDPASVEASLTARTRAIIAVDIFGQSANMTSLREIAHRRGLKLVSDTAQAPGARIGPRFAGTLADIGGFSLNYHKHIHTGEGGVMVSDNPELAERMRLIRNHAEAVVQRSGVTDLRNMLGHNFRLGEIEAAIGLEQLKKLHRLVETRRRLAAKLDAGLSSLSGLITPTVRSGVTHVYYIYALTLQPAVVGVARERIVAALAAEGVPYLVNGYTNVHMLPIFQQKTAYGTPGFPWNAAFCSRDVDYRHGICPVAERLHDEQCFIFEICQPDLSDTDVALIVDAFHKVWAHLDDLR